MRGDDGWEDEGGLRVACEAAHEVISICTRVY
jgi:hypothetical protein